MTNVVPFRNAAQEDAESAIHVLQDLLADAEKRDGTVRSVAIAFIDQEGGLAHAWSGTRMDGALLGAITLLSKEYSNGFGVEHQAIEGE